MTRRTPGDEPSNGETPGARLRDVLESLTEQLEDFTRRRPIEGLLVSFIAGMLIADLFRRNR